MTSKLFDPNTGEPIGVVDDSGIKRLQVEAKVSDGGGSLTVDGTVTANQGTAAVLSGYWPIRVTDGTNTMPTGDAVGRAIFYKITDGTNTATVKAASTAAVASDQALVVAVSPNNTVSTTNASASQVDGHSSTIGATTDTDTANTVIGRLKQIITRLAGGLPSSLVGGRLDSNIGSWLGSTTPTVGQKAMTSSVPIVVASDQTQLPLRVDGASGSSFPSYVIALGSKQSGASTLRSLASKFDATESEYRLLVDAKAQLTPPVAPPSTTPKTVTSSTPLTVTGNSTHTADYIIPSGKTFHMQQVVCGAEGDPNERGSKVEIFYVDSSSVEHLVERIYLQSTTQYGIYPDTDSARDGTLMSGNGTTTLIRINRIRLGGGNAEIDVVLRGYES